MYLEYIEMEVAPRWVTERKPLVPVEVYRVIR